MNGKILTITNPDGTVECLSYDDAAAEILRLRATSTTTQAELVLSKAVGVALAEALSALRARVVEVGTVRMAWTDRIRALSNLVKEVEKTE